MQKGLILLALGVALATAGCSSNPQTNKELKCAGGVLGGAALGGLIGNQIGGGTGKQLATAAGAGVGRRGRHPDPGLQVSDAGSARATAGRSRDPRGSAARSARSLRIDSRHRRAVNRPAPAEPPAMRFLRHVKGANPWLI